MNNKRVQLEGLKTEISLSYEPLRAHHARLSGSPRKPSRHSAQVNQALREQWNPTRATLYITQEEQQPTSLATFSFPTRARDADLLNLFFKYNIIKAQLAPLSLFLLNIQGCPSPDCYGIQGDVVVKR